MRKFLLITASLVFVSAIVAAQHVNMSETPAKGNLTVASDVMLGTSVLKAGDYRFSCDRENITFSNQATGKTELKVPCKGHEMQTPAAETVMHVTTDASGKKVVTKLLLKGSNVEHVFQVQ